MTTLYKVIISADNPEETDPKLLVYSAKKVALTDEEVAEFNARPLPSLEEEHRQKRDYLLSGTDHLMLPDRPVSQAMLDYRQALRDITTHANWPNLQESDWPTKPE